MISRTGHVGQMSSHRLNQFHKPVSNLRHTDIHQHMEICLDVDRTFRQTDTKITLQSTPHNIYIDGNVSSCSLIDKIKKKDLKK
jgi:hypothetical protein